MRLLKISLNTIVICFCFTINYAQEAGFTGIGTLSPTQKLHIKEGTIRLESLSEDDPTYDIGPTNAYSTLVVDVDGIVKKAKAAMPKFFYMPSVVFDTSNQGTGFTRDLHQNYVDQFGSPVVSSSGASGAIPTLDANDLEYYITYYDDTVFENVTIDAVGSLTYDVISSTNSAASFMNIVFVVK